MTWAELVEIEPRLKSLLRSCGLRVIACKPDVETEGAAR
jgi:hypothetical protein